MRCSHQYQCVAPAGEEERDRETCGQSEAGVVEGLLGAGFGGLGKPALAGPARDSRGAFELDDTTQRAAKG